MDRKEGKPKEAINSIDLNTPNLSSFVFCFKSRSKEIDPESVRPVEFRFPLKIRHLECVEFKPSMGELTNLETLNCEKIGSPFKLADFESLKRLELFPRTDEELNSVKEIIGQKEQLKRSSLEIIVCGFKDHLISHESEFAIQFSAAEAQLNDHFLDQIAGHPAHFVGRISWQFSLGFDPTVEDRSKELSGVFFKRKL